jgi:hypothetical protein
MWDHQHGGWYWMIGRDGVVLQTSIIVNANHSIM